MDADSFQLSPADVEARFAAMPRPGLDDPLFRPIDADDFDANGANASDYSNLRQNGLIRVRLPLPANIKLVDPASCLDRWCRRPRATRPPATPSRRDDFTDVWRAVPSVFNVKLTGPDPQTAAWPRGPNPQGDTSWTAAKPRLPTRRSARSETTRRWRRIPTRDAGRHRRLRRDPARRPRTAARRPRDAWERPSSSAPAASATTARGWPRPLPRDTDPLFALHDVETTCPRPVDTAVPPRWNFPPCPPALARNERTYEISFADGYKMRRTTSDPGRALLSGFVGLGRPRQPTILPACISRAASVSQTTGRSWKFRRCMESARRRPTSTTTAPRRWKTSSSTTRSSTSTCCRASRHCPCRSS